MDKDVENLAKVLAVLVADGNYTYVDKIGNAPSKDLLAFYMKEAMRDFHSIIRGGTKNEKAEGFLKDLKSKIESGNVNLDASVKTFLDRIPEGDRQKLRELSSILAARALAISAKYIKSSKEIEGGE